MSSWPGKLMSVPPSIENTSFYDMIREAAISLEASYDLDKLIDPSGSGEPGEYDEIWKERRSASLDMAKIMIEYILQYASEQDPLEFAQSLPSFQDTDLKSTMYLLLRGMVQIVETLAMLRYVVNNNASDPDIKDYADRLIDWCVEKYWEKAVQVSKHKQQTVPDDWIKNP